MRCNDSASLEGRKAIFLSQSGLFWGFVGVAAFSFTVPLTRVTVEGNALPPLFVGAGRAVVAAVLAGAVLVFTRQRLPSFKESASVLIVMLGAVLGFPLLISYALTVTTASHGASIIALLPATTAIVASIRTRSYPSRRFWVAAIVGALIAVTLSFYQSGTKGSISFSSADLLLFLAVILCAMGYAEGGVVAKTLGSWQTISWALVMALPITLPFSFYIARSEPLEASIQQWLAFSYLCVVSMYLGFFAWYRGMSIGPMAQVSQIQLVQPVLSLVWSFIFLSEEIGVVTILGSGLVITCSVIAIRTKNKSEVNEQGE